tara:strand:+ start:1701 stop:1982 length:282 start_codon:yes stop_codon:yes gene_type:complete
MAKPNEMAEKVAKGKSSAPKSKGEDLKNQAASMLAQMKTVEQTKKNAADDKPNVDAKKKIADADAKAKKEAEEQRAKLKKATMKPTPFGEVSG